MQTPSAETHAARRNATAIWARFGSTLNDPILPPRIPQQETAFNALSLATGPEADWRPQPRTQTPTSGGPGFPNAPACITRVQCTGQRITQSDEHGTRDTPRHANKPQCPTQGIQNMLIRMGLGGQLSGSVGGVTASHNRYGQYLRNRTKPVNPNSERQQAARSSFAASTLRWKALTELQRQAWAAYAAMTPKLNKLGESVTLSPNAWYVATNTFRKSVTGPNLAAVDTAPFTPGLDESTFTFSSALTATNIITFTQTGAADLVALFLGPAVSAGVSSFSGPYTLIAATEDGAPGSIAFDMQPNRYGELEPGQNRPFRIAGYNSTTRKLTASSKGIALVV